MVIYQRFTQPCNLIRWGVKIRVSTTRILVPAPSIRFRAGLKDRVLLHKTVNITLAKTVSGTSEPIGHDMPTRVWMHVNQAIRSDHFVINKLMRTPQTSGTALFF